MGFDIARAVTEALSSRLPFLDRLLSYLYFADMGVLEQSSSDTFGRGVSIVGRRGPDGPCSVVLAAPLPGSPSLAGLDPGSPDASRAAVLLAMAWAVASLDAARMDRPVLLVAARPDPTGDGLRAVVDGWSVPGTVAIASAPTGPAPRSPACDVALLSVLVEAPVRPLRTPLADVVTLVSPGSARPAAAALAALHRASAGGSVEPLALHAATGVHLAEPDALRATVGLAGPHGDVPDGWSIEARPARIGSAGSIRDRLRLLDAGIASVSGTCRDAWSRPGMTLPKAPVRLLDPGTGPEGTALLAACIPPGGDGDRALVALAAPDRPEPLPDGVRVSVIDRFRCGRPDAPVPAVLDTASCVAGSVARVVALGPVPGEFALDPAARTSDWAARYRDALLAAGDDAGSRRPGRSR